MMMMIAVFLKGEISEFFIAFEIYFLMRLWRQKDATFIIWHDLVSTGMKFQQRNKNGRFNAPLLLLQSKWHYKDM